MIRPLLAVVLSAGAVTVAGCGSSPTPTPTVTNTVTNTVTLAAPTTASPVEAPSEAPPAVAGTTWTMPNLIGWNLQDAQDEIQRISDQQIFYTGSTDLTGAGRNQVLDRNWQVCTSSPEPGTPITKETAIDFGVVRADVEDCP